MRQQLISRGLQILNASFDLLGGPLYELFGYGVSRSELESFFGIAPEHSRKVAWASAATCCKSWNQQRFVRRFGLEGVANLIHWETPPATLVRRFREGSPTLLVSWHSGPLYSVPAALYASDLEALCCVGPPPPFQAPAGLTYVPTRGGDFQRAEALHQALKRLQEGGIVYLVADHPTYSQSQASICGRMASFSPSIFMLSKVSGAWVIPVVGRWEPTGKILIRHGCPIESAASEEDLLRQLARWYEDYFRARPHVLEPKYLMKLMFSPEEKP